MWFLSEIFVDFYEGRIGLRYINSSLCSQG